MIYVLTIIASDVRYVRSWRKAIRALESKFGYTLMNFYERFVLTDIILNILRISTSSSVLLWTLNHVFYLYAR